MPRAFLDLIVLHILQQTTLLNVLSGMVKDGTLDEEWPARTLEVLNKADLLGGVDQVPISKGAIAVSAIDGEGLDRLKAAIDARIGEGMQVVTFTLAPSDGAGQAWLYQHGEVVAREDDAEAIRMTVRLRPADRMRFEADRA